MSTPELSAEHRRRTTPPHAPRPWPLPVTTSPRIRALEAELAQAPGSTTSIIDAFLRELGDRGTPLIEPSDDPASRIVTFVHVGPEPQVYLTANKVTDNFAPAEGRLHQIAASEVSALSLRMPADWLGSYHFLTPEAPFEAAEARLNIREVLRQSGVMRSDPRNPRQRPNKLAPHAPHSVVELPDAPPEPETASFVHWRTASADLTLPASGSTQRVTVRSHPSAGTDSPAVVLLDGEVWLEDALLAGALSHRIESGATPPIHLVYLPSGGPTTRQLDYPADASEQLRLFDGLAALLDDVAGPRGWHGKFLPAGQSLGGLFALFAAVRAPERVLGAIAQSPSLWWPTTDAFTPGPGAWFAELGAARDAAPCVVQYGRTEWLLAERTEHAREFLRGLGRLVPTEHDAVMGGHDVVWWRRTLPGAIAALL